MTQRKNKGKKEDRTVTQRKNKGTKEDRAVTQRKRGILVILVMLQILLEKN